MKKFNLKIDDASGRKQSVDIYVGEPYQSISPLYFQQQWWRNQRGVELPRNVLDSFEKLQKVSIEENLTMTETIEKAFEDNDN